MPAGVLVLSGLIQDLVPDLHPEDAPANGTYRHSLPGALDDGGPCPQRRAGSAHVLEKVTIRDAEPPGHAGTHQAKAAAVAVGAVGGSVQHPEPLASVA